MNKVKKAIIIKNIAFILMFCLGFFTIIGTSGGGSSQSTDTAIDTKLNVNILAPNNNSSFTEGDKIAFNASASYETITKATESDITYLWNSSIDGNFGENSSITKDNLSVGSHTITFTAKDTKGNTASVSISITISKNFAPMAYIDAPSSLKGCNVVQSGDSITFNGRGIDTEDGVLDESSLIWTSNINGIIGKGYYFTIGTLGIGVHKITLTVTDKHGLSDTEEICVEIKKKILSTSTKNNPPIATIDTSGTTGKCSCSNPCKYNYNDYVVLNGKGVDTEDGALSGNNLSWYSSIDGALGTGNSFPSKKLSIGKHIITLIVTDSVGLTDSTSICIEILTNNIPSVYINNPSGCSSNTPCKYTQGDVIVFNGYSIDSEDGTLPDSNLSWYSNIDGLIGSGSSLKYQLKSAGFHTITLIAKDKNGATGTDVTYVEILQPQNTPPVAKILAPFKNSVYGIGVKIVFMGQGVDNEDGLLLGSSLTWSSSINGQLGSGDTITVSNLSKGTHTIFFTAKDRLGAINRDSITITISNQAPTVTILSPQNGYSYAEGYEISFSGKATDMDGAEIIGDSLVWFSDKDEEIGKGVSFKYDNLSKGKHIITLVATDIKGTSGSNSIILTIGNTEPTAYIDHPSELNGCNCTTLCQYNQTQVVILNGRGIDPEDGSLSGTQLVWTSSINGQLGTGNTVSVPQNTLSIGIHKITLTVTDTNGLSDTEETCIDIVKDTSQNTVPTATIFQINSSIPCSCDSPCKYPIGKYVILNGKGEDTEDGILSGSSLSWFSSLNGSLGNGNSIETNTLLVGSHIITLIVKDSYGSTGFTSICLEVLNNSLPVVEILSPSNGSTFEQNSNISFVGKATDTEDGDLSSTLSWLSSIDGDMGNGVSVQKKLSNGKHTIILRAKDSYQAVKESSIVITVGNNLPNAYIDYPSGCASNAPCKYKEGSSIIFMGRGIDSEDGSLTGDNLIWTSNINGQIGTNTSVSVNNLSAGNHTVRLTVKDLSGLTAFEETWVEIVKDTSKNNPPTAEIFQPNSAIQCSCSSPCQYSLGKYVILNGKGEDIEDGILSGNSLSWFSSLNGPLGNGNSIETNQLLVGSHIITLIAKDSYDSTGFASTCLEILNNSLPTVEILTPSNGSSFTTGANISFVGKATDPEYGDLYGSSLYWYSSIDGEIGTGVSFQKNNLSNGKHTIILKATDNDGGVKESSIVIIVGNNLPNAYIDYPSECASNAPCQYKQGNSIVFMGRGVDDEDGILTGDSLIWTSNINGQIGTNTNISVNDLSVGTHTIRLTVKDSIGITDFKETWINISTDITKNTSPTATIEPPMNLCSSNSPCQYNRGDLITIIGRGDDNEDGNLTSDTNLFWYSSIKGKIGTGPLLSINDLESGDHTITLVATDNNGACGSTSIYLQILNSLPVVEILNPANGSFFAENANIYLLGKATDKEDGDLSSSLSWSSNIDAYIGTGASIETGPLFPKKLSNGKHTITAKATDKSGGVKESSIVITVGNTLNAYIDYPSGCTSIAPCQYKQGNSVVFMGRGVDTEDGTLTGESLIWTSDISGQIGTGNSLSVNNLALGKHTIRLTVKNSGGLTAFKETWVEISNVENNSPQAYIDYPSVCTAIAPCQYKQGNSVVLMGRGVDTEDGTLTGESLIW
ncbi:MAG: PKD domain-containing protein, partial [Desulfobacterales bacterium]|nr:PKD domain-containing protein [Desulfobacterales bacterium]